MASRPLALITGASSGIGAAFARAYAARGHDLALVARREDRLQSLGDELSVQHSVEVLVIAVDLSTTAAEARVMDAIAAAGRHVDVLVNNAGFSVAESFIGVPWSRQRDMLMTMVVSAVGLTHAVLPGMVERGSGVVINVASLAGFAPGTTGHSLYPGVKSLAIKFSQSLDAELRGKGIRITAICPGFTLTEFAEANGTKGVMDQAPRRMFQTAEAVVETAIAANGRGKVVVVPGWHNQLAALLLRYLPEPLVTAIIRRGSAKYHLGD